MPRTSFRRRIAKKNTPQTFDKYEFYRRSVQSPEGDVLFLANTYKQLTGKNPAVLREDFCGTASLSTEWVKSKTTHQAFGIDLDPEPMDYARTKYFTKLSPSERRRIELQEKNVLEPGLPKADIAIAMNFSYFCFKSRPVMKKYFANVHRSLKSNGLFICDVFGGSQCQDAIVDVTKHNGFRYYWDQTGFDPVSNEALFHIHFKVGSKKYEKVFSYDWRMWSIPELRDIMDEVGFKKTHIYWEGTNRQGGGNGIFSRTEHGEPCLSWIAYIVAEK